MKRQKIKILIVDDHDLIRQGLKRILSFQEDFDIIGEAENGQNALRIIEDNKPDVLIIDLNMPLMNGIEVLKNIRESELDIKVIMLTVENDSRILHKAIDVGADGYMLKDSAGTEIVDAIRTVYVGKKYIDRSLVSLLFIDIKNKDNKFNNKLDLLSKREIEVLIKISNGLSNREIGEQLFLSEKTVKNYATNLFRKINVEDRVHATIIAIQNNIEEYYNLKYKE